MTKAAHRGLPRPRLRSRRSLFVIVCLAVLMQPVAAIASWQSGGNKVGTIIATEVLRPAAPSAAQSGSSAVRLNWTATTLATGLPVEGYEVRRRVGAGASVAVCTTVAPTRTCDDTSPVTSTVTYGVVAIFKSWRSQESPLTPYTHDLTNPVTTATSNPAPNAAGWNNTAVTVTLSASDASGVANVRYRVNSGSTVTTAGSSVSFTVNAQGTTTITYWATDNVGNAEAQRTHVVRVDTVAPTGNVTNLRISNDTGSSTTDGITNNANQTVSGSAPANSTLNIRVGGNLVATTTASGGGNFSVALPNLAVDGQHTVTARVVDLAGNEGPTATFAIKLDRTAPGGQVDFPVPGGSYDPWAMRNGCDTSPWNVRYALCGLASDSGYSGGLDLAVVRLAIPAMGICWNGASPTGNPPMANVNSFTASACNAPPTRPITGTTPPRWSAVVGGSQYDISLVLTVTIRDKAGNATALTPVAFDAED